MTIVYVSISFLICSGRKERNHRVKRLASTGTSNSIATLKIPTKLHVQKLLHVITRIFTCSIHTHNSEPCGRSGETDVWAGIPRNTAVSPASLCQWTTFGDQTLSFTTSKSTHHNPVVKLVAHHCLRESLSTSSRQKCHKYVHVIYHTILFC